MKLLISDVRNIRNTLNTAEFFEMPISSKFRFMVISNVNILEPEMTKIIGFEEGISLPENHAEFEVERKEILSRYGVSAISDFEKMNEKTAKEFENEIADLNIKFNDVVEGLKVIKTIRDEFYSKSVELPLKTINVNDVPVISKAVGDNHWKVWNTIMPLIVD